MVHLCPKCLDGEEVTMERVSVSKAITQHSVGELFSQRYMYLPYRCPKCGFEEKYSTYRWHFLVGSWMCMKCRDSEAGSKELRKSVQGNIIEVDYRCLKCGNEWLTKIEYYKI